MKTHLIIFKVEGNEAIEKTLYFRGTWDETKVFVEEYRKVLYKSVFGPNPSKDIFATIIDAGTLQTFAKRFPIDTFESKYLVVTQ